MYNGIKVDGKLYKAWYGTAIREHLGVITIYSSGYESFPKMPELLVENDTDIMTDYFEKDRIYVYPDNPHYEAVKLAMEKKREKIVARHAKRIAKNIS
jgi:hypothetical protein